MKKILYIFRIVIFILYLLAIFLMIDNLYKPNFFSITYFLLNVIYSFIIILTILSKKKIFQATISYNILNIGIYIYTFMLYRIVYTKSSLDIISNQVYFRNNFIMLSILLVGIITYTLVLNKEENDN